jgi:hypothetical protein
MRLGKIAHQNRQKHAHNHTAPERPAQLCAHILLLDARNHYPQIKHHTPPPSGATTRQPPNGGPAITPGFLNKDEGVTGLLSQSPIVCPAAPAPHEGDTGEVCCAPEPPPTTGAAHLTNRSYTRTPTRCGRGTSHVVLLRKEVIQPHLPVRLPCYDFVPIADPTFDRSLPYGLGHGLRVLPTFMT